MPAEKVVIIGSGPAGLTAALYAARANMTPVLVEGLEAGGQLMLTTAVENFPGFPDGVMGPDLMAKMRDQAVHFGTQVVQGDVTSVDLQKRPFMLHLADGRRISTETLIIATGASARWLDIGSDRRRHRVRLLRRAATRHHAGAGCCVLRRRRRPRWRVD